MRLPTPTPAYSQQDQSQTRRALEQADMGNQKVGRDVDIGGARLILTAPDGGRWVVSVDNAGNLGTTAL